MLNVQDKATVPLDLHPLLRPQGPWLHLLLVPLPEAYEALAKLPHAHCADAGRLLRGAKMTGTAALFDEFAAVLQFPPTCSVGWHALDKCLTDLNWLHCGAYALLIADSPQLLADESPAELTKLLQMLERAGHEWGAGRSGPQARPARALHVFLQAAPADEAALRAKRVAAQVGFTVVP